MLHLSKIILTLLFIVSLQLTLYAQNISGSLTVNNQFFSYQTTLKSKDLYELTIRTLDKLNSSSAQATLVYFSQVQILKSNQTEVRVYTSQRQGANWNIMRTECMRMICQNGQLSYEIVGSTLQPYISEVQENQIVRSCIGNQFNDKQAITFTIQHFIRQCYKYLGLTGNLNIKPLVQEGTIATASATYSYEIQGDWQNTKQAVVYIRQGAKGLVYQSQIAVSSDHKKVQILYAKRKELSWEVYGSDLWQMVFEPTTQTGLSSKIGLFLPPLAPQTPQSFDWNSRRSEVVKFAVENFIRQYEQLF